jgi:Fe-S-cluster containining protein
MRVYCLSVHAAYRCHDSGACCTSRWPIPVETARFERLQEALRAGVLRAADNTHFVRPHDLATGYAALLDVTDEGSCAFYERNARRCAIHCALGPDALPAACQHFPRACLIDRDAVSVTFSHYCPSVASLIFDGDAPLAVVEAPSSLVPARVEGLDARDALPPLLHPRMLADRESYRRWERLAVSLLATSGTPESALLRIIDFTERVREWQPGRLPLDQAIDAAFPAAPERRGNGWAEAEAATIERASFEEDALVRRSVPYDLDVAEPPGNVAALFGRLVAPEWPRFSEPIRRFLASHLFANWCAYQGRGLRTVVRSVTAALSVLRVEAARHCGLAGRPLDEALLIEAVRSSDLLLVHLASREELARRLGGIEDGGVEEMVRVVRGSTTRLSGG